MHAIATRLFFIFLLMVGSIFAQSWKELNSQGMQAYKAGDYGKAAVYWEKALKQAEKEFGKNHENYATACDNLAVLYDDQGKYSEAEPLYKEALAIYAKVLGKDHPDYANSCNNLALLYYAQGKYSEAEPLLKEAKEIYAKVLDKEHPDYALSCNNLAGLYKAQGKYSEAEPLYKEALSIRAKVLGKDHPDYATSCDNLAGLYDKQGKYSEAEPLYKEALSIRAKVLGKHHPDYALSCNNLAALYEKQGKYSEAEPLLKEALSIRAKVLGKDHPYYALSCNNLAGLYEAQGNYSEAEPLYREAKEIYAKVLGKEHPYYALSCNSLALLYKAQGKYSEAEPLYKEALAIGAKVLGKEHPDYAQSCNNLAALYYAQGKYSEAEPLYKEALAIRAKVLGKEHPDYAGSCNNLAELYRQQGKYSEAEPLYKEALSIRAKVLGKDHPDYATSCNNLAELYRQQGKYSEAEPLYKESLAIRAKVLGKEHPYYAQSCNNLALLYDDQGKYSEAEPLYKEAKEIYAKVLGKDHPDYALSCNNLAALYYAQGKYSEAEALYKEAKEIIAKVLGKEHPNYAIYCNNLGLLYEKQGKYSEAEPFYKEASQTLIRNIQRNFIGLSEKEKKQYFATFQSDFERYFSFVLKANKPELCAWLLENNLITKGLMFYSTTQLRRKVEQSGDKNLLSLYEQWLSKRKEVSKAYEMGEAKRKEKNIRIEVLLQEADELEKQISAGLAQKGIKAELTPQLRSWKEIQQKLQANEALVEMTRINYYDKDKTDSVIYVALVVKKNSVYPEMVVFADGNVLERQKDNYRNRYIINKMSKEDKKSYNIFYEPLKRSLSGIEKIYFCSDGVYHQINLNTLYNPETGKYLMDEIEVQYVSTARDFIELSKKSLKENLSSYQVHLFGYPDYSGGKQVSPSEGANQEERSLAQSLRSRMNENNQRFYNSTIESVALLPGTKTEVEKIYSIVKKNGMQCKVYLGLEASEERLKSLSGVNILHIATHGFFFSGSSSKKEEYDNPLNRSGLLLAGAEVSFKGGIYGKENGIVLSNEVMNLNLNGTDLVVLSACETGLGDVQSGEGVFGLQRSFQEAGARNVVMSLWTVDDEATQRLMVEFYEELLNKKVSSRQALKNSIQRIRQSYPEPYYWGAFVIIGE